MEMGREAPNTRVLNGKEDLLAYDGLAKSSLNPTATNNISNHVSTKAFDENCGKNSATSPIVDISTQVPSKVKLDALKQRQGSIFDDPEIQAWGEFLLELITPRLNNFSSLWIAHLSFEHDVTKDTAEANFKKVLHNHDPSAIFVGVAVCEGLKHSHIHAVILTDKGRARLWFLDEWLYRFGLAEEVGDGCDSLRDELFYLAKNLVNDKGEFFTNIVSDKEPPKKC